MKKEQGLLQVLRKKEKSLWEFGNKKESAGMHEFEIQKNSLIWAMEELNFSKEESEQVQKTITFLKDRYTDSNGKFGFRTSAKNAVSGNPEPTINHPLGVAIIALGILDEGKRSDKLTKEEKSGFDVLIKKKRAVVLSGMLHDFCEDEKGDEYCIRRALKQVDIPKTEIEEIILTGQILTRQNQAGMRETAEQYIHRVRQSKSLLALFLKGVDIVHNALSKHTESQKKKYNDHYMHFVFDVFPFAGNILPKWMEKQIFTENKYLREVAKREEKLLLKSG
jgi:hypothetical protein